MVSMQTGHRNPDEMGRVAVGYREYCPESKSAAWRARRVLLAVAAGLCEKNELAYDRVCVYVLVN